MITDEIIVERLNTCRSCEFLKIGFICGKCYCPIKAKVKKVPKEYCEAGKWKR